MRFFCECDCVFTSHSIGCVDVRARSHGTMCDCDFLRYRNWILWLLMTLFTILECDVIHEWVLYLFCVIAICDSNVRTCKYKWYINQSSCVNNFTKTHTCIKLLSHAEQIAPSEWTLNDTVQMM